MTPESLDRGSKEPLALLHGLSGCPAQWNPILPALSGSYRILCPPLAGHEGGPPLVRAPGHCWAISELAEQVCRDMDTADMPTAHFCGNSLGGWLALELARRGRARSVVALAPAGGWEEASPEQTQIHRRMRRNYRALKVIGPMAGVLSRWPFLRRGVLRDVMVHGERLSAADAATVLRAAWRCPSYLELLNALVEEGPHQAFDGITVPVAVVWGTRDRLLPAEAYAARHRRLLAQARFVEVEGAGHLVMADDPRAVVAIVGATAESAARSTHAPERIGDQSSPR